MAAIKMVCVCVALTAELQMRWLAEIHCLRMSVCLLLGLLGHHTLGRRSMAISQCDTSMHLCNPKNKHRLHTHINIYTDLYRQLFEHISKMHTAHHL